MKKVRKIEVPEKDSVKKLRVVAYCSVSTKYESQKSSIELQKCYYENYIKEHSNWIYLANRPRVERSDAHGLFSNVRESMAR